MHENARKCTIAADAQIRSAREPPPAAGTCRTADGPSAVRQLPAADGSPRESTVQQSSPRASSPLTATKQSQPKRTPTPASELQLRKCARMFHRPTHRGDETKPTAVWARRDFGVSECRSIGVSF